MQICKDCNKEQPIENFYTYKTKTKGNMPRKICKKCTNVNTRQSVVMRYMDLDQNVIKCESCENYLKVNPKSDITKCLKCRRKQHITYWYRSENWRKERLDGNGIWNGAYKK